MKSKAYLQTAIDIANAHIAFYDAEIKKAEAEVKAIRKDRSAAVARRARFSAVLRVAS